MSEVTLKVGKKGEIFTNADLRKKANIKQGSKVKARVIKTIDHRSHSFNRGVIEESSHEDDYKRGRET